MVKYILYSLKQSNLKIMFRQVIIWMLIAIFSSSCKQKTDESKVIQTKNDSILFAKKLNKFAIKYSERESYDTAIAIFNTAILLDFHNMGYRENRATNLAISGRYHLAIREFQLLLKNDSNLLNPTRISFIAGCYFKLNELDSSTKYINSAVSEASMTTPTCEFDSSMTASIYVKQAYIQRKKGLLKESIATYKKAIEYGFHDCSDYYFIAALYLELNEPQNQRYYYNLSKKNGCQDAEDSLRKYKFE